MPRSGQNKTKTNTWQWILDESLPFVFTRLYRLASQNPSLLNGNAHARAVWRLVQCEVQAGGPYHDGTGIISYEANAAIDQYLQTLGITLPNLQLYRNTQQPAKLRNSRSGNPRTYEAIQTAVAAHLRILPRPLRQPALAMHQAVLGADHNLEIGLISSYFAEALRTKGYSKVELQKLGVANVFTWMAYTIYDDFFDDEGTPLNLAVANWAARQAYHEYVTVYSNPVSQRLVTKICTVMDAANAWEVRHARAEIQNNTITISALPAYDNYMILADRALAHVLGPLLLTRNNSVSAKQYSHVTAGLKHYLIARQLNDDLHDWRQDLQAGHLSSVVTYLLGKTSTGSGKQNIPKLITRLEALFWQQGLEELCCAVQDHITKSRQAFTKSKLMHPAGTLYTLLDRLDRAIETGRCALQHDKDFLAAYHRLSQEDYN